MNHLRELLELPLSGMLIRDGIGDNEASRFFAELRDAGERAMCFSLGDYEDFDSLELTPLKELCRLPYGTCWFEVAVNPPTGPRWLFGCLIDTQPDGKLVAQGFSRGPVRWALRWRAKLDDLHPTWARSTPTGAIGEVAQGLAVVAKFLSALNCSNVHRQEHAPAAKLQKARAKRGKAPLFSYWTLQLDGKSERGENQGGTHASPRVHLRRGHPRQYAPGKWTWVQAHAVGNRADGVVHKDYSTGPALAVAAR